MNRIESITWRTVAVMLMLTGGLTGPAVAAEDETAYTELDYLMDIPDVVSATRMSQKLTQAPAAITVITREMIEAAPVFRIEDLFRLVPGMQSLSVSHNTWMVTYHGVSNNFPDALEIMVDGRSVYLPFLSTVDWNSLGLSLDDIDHIEVVRGSNVPAYGSNAFLGAINIVTRSPLTESGSSARLLGGSNGQQLVEARHADFNENFSYRISTGYRANDGSDLYGDNQQQRYANLALSMSPALTDTIDLQLGLAEGHTYIGNADKLDDQPVPRDNQSNYQYLRWNRVLDASQDLQLTFSRSDFDMTTPSYTAEELLRRDNPSLSADMALAIARSLNMDGVRLWADSENGESTVTELELQYVRHLSESLDMVLGGAYRWEDARSPTLLGNDERLAEERTTAFGNLQWHQTEQWIWNFGAMLEHFSATSATRASPRAAVNYLVSENLVFRAAYTRAYRMPSLIEPHISSTVYDNTGQIWDVVLVENPDLRPERLDSWELGSYWRSRDHALELDLRFYLEDIQDGIEERFHVLDPADQDGHYIRKENISSWKNRGFEVQGNLRPWDGGSFWLAYGYQDVDGGFVRGQKRLDDAGEGLRLTPLDDTAPKHTLSLLYDQQFAEHWKFSLAEYYMSEVNWPEGGLRDDWWRTDVKLARTFTLDPRWTLESSVIAQNLFESQNEEFYPYNRSERRVFLQLVLKAR